MQKLADRGREAIDKVFMGMTIVLLFFILAMVACAFMFLHWVDGTIFVGVLLFIAYLIF